MHRKVSLELQRDRGKCMLLPEAVKQCLQDVKHSDVISSDKIFSILMTLSSHNPPFNKNNDNGDLYSALTKISTTHFTIAMYK